MFRLIALIISIVLQLIAVAVALRLTKITKYKISWILISFGFVFMAVRRFIDLIQFLKQKPVDELNLLNDWIAVLISILISLGVIIIPEIFSYIKKEEKERKRFANDLHDGLGPLLSTIKLSLSALIKTEQDQSKLNIIKNAEKVTEEAITSIKEISSNISPHILKNYGLVSAIKKFSDKIVDSGILTIDFQSNMRELRFETNLEILIYRSVCELINNTIKHAQAENVNINLTYNHNNNILDILYDDDGIGCNIDEILNGNTIGMGLQNIVSRISSVNGFINIESKIDNGFHTYISIKTDIINENA